MDADTARIRRLMKAQLQEDQQRELNRLRTINAEQEVEIKSLRHCYKLLDEHREKLQARNTQLASALDQTIQSLNYWFKRHGDSEGANSQMMINARAALAKAGA